MVQEYAPATADEYTGALFDPGYGVPSVQASARQDYLAQQNGSDTYEERPGVPNYLDVQSDGYEQGVGGYNNSASGMPALAPDPAMGYSPIPQYSGSWYDSQRTAAGYPLPVPHDFGTASQFPVQNDAAAIAANEDFGIDDYVRFNQPQLVADGHRITERTLDIPVPWKAEPTFPVQIQKVRPWDRFMGAWPWTGTKTGIPQAIQAPVYYATPIANPVVSPGGSSADVPNTPSLMPQPMTWRVIPEQWDTNYIVSGQ